MLIAPGSPSICRLRGRFDVGVVAWGDSLTSGNGSVNGGNYPARFAVASGLSVFNAGVGGETSTQIKTRELQWASGHSTPAIIWAGRNNFTDPSTVKADIAAMVAALGHTHYLVLSVINRNDTASEYSGGADYTMITTLNADLAALYGSHYVDVRSCLVSLYDPLDAQDVIDHGRDCPPSSLTTDGLHLNNAGYQAVADKVYQSIGVLTQ